MFECFVCIQICSHGYTRYLGFAYWLKFTSHEQNISSLVRNDKIKIKKMAPVLWLKILFRSLVISLLFSIGCLAQTILDIDELSVQYGIEITNKPVILNSQVSFFVKVLWQQFLWNSTSMLNCFEVLFYESTSFLLLFPFIL